jgi:hypothetical protein
VDWFAFEFLAPTVNLGLASETLDCGNAEKRPNLDDMTNRIGVPSVLIGYMHRESGTAQADSCRR